MIIVFLAVIGLISGSFVNALVWRLHNKKYSIMKGRSVCPNCEHELSVADLIPVFSWVALGGRCRYCGEKIHWQYPAVEITTAGLFVGSYIFWPNALHLVPAVIEFIVWLVMVTGFMALIVYDLRWQLLPNRVVFPLFLIAVIGLTLRTILSSDIHLMSAAAVGAIAGGGLFYILFQLSGGTWIGGGDVKLGFLLGMLVGGPTLAVLMLFIASFLGTIFSMPLLVTGRLKPHARIPFGPFLIASTFITQLFGESLINIYWNTLL